MIGHIVIAKPERVSPISVRCRGVDPHNGLNLSVNLPRGLEAHMKRAVDQGALVACAIENNAAGGGYNAGLLVPPGIDKNSPLFVPGLVIPDLRVFQVLRNRDGIMGYILTSHYYAGDRSRKNKNQFYLGFRYLDNREKFEQGFTFQGKVEYTKKSEGKKVRPVVVPIDNVYGYSFHGQNVGMFGKIAQVKDECWWNLDFSENVEKIESNGDFKSVGRNFGIPTDLD